MCPDRALNICGDLKRRGAGQTAARRFSRQGNELRGRGRARAATRRVLSAEARGVLVAQEVRRISQRCFWLSTSHEFLTCFLCFLEVRGKGYRQVYGVYIHPRALTRERTSISKVTSQTADTLVAFCGVSLGRKVRSE